MPVNSLDSDSVRIALGSACYDALTLSRLWHVLESWDRAPQGSRKNTSHFGAVIARSFHRRGARSPYTDGGNFTYAICIHFLMLFATHMGMDSLTELMKITNRERHVERAGDLFECVAALPFVDRPECQHGQDWESAPWLLDSDEHNETCRLLTIFAYVEMLQTTEARINALSDVDNTFRDIDGMIRLLQERRSDLGEGDRRRSIEGSRRLQSRNDARAEMRRAKGKGKTPPSSGGYPKGKGCEKGKGKGK